MNSDNLNLEKIIDFRKWQELQDNIATVTNMAMITVDYKGNPITKHSQCQSFCQAVRHHKEISKYCEKCDSRGGLEAARSNEPYIYRCHYNIIDIAIPITVEGRYIGAIMAGQFKLRDEREQAELEQIVSVTHKKLATDILDELNTEYKALPTKTYEEVQAAANMLSSLCRYLVESALEKNLILEMYENTVKSRDGMEGHNYSGYSLTAIESVKKDISNAMVDAYLENKSTGDESYVEVSSVLKPAITYIYEHKSESVSLEQMANLCHISPSYFSRLFSKELGENFSNYVTHLKIKWAKCLLEDSDLNVNEISEELGFNETGYFIKLFKKYEGVTPAIYRRYYKQKLQ